MGKIFQTLGIPKYTEVYRLALLPILFIIFLTTLSIATQTFSQDSQIDIKNAVRVNGAVSSNVICNTTIYYPNKTILVDYKQMTRQNSYFNYTLNSSQTNTKGLYTYDVTCTDGTLNETESFDFFINLGGVEPTAARTDTLSRTIWIFFSFGIISCLVAIFSKRIPIKISFIIFTIWFFLTTINTAFLAVQDEIVNPSVENFLSFFLVISHYINYALLFSVGVVWIITLIVSLISQNQIKKEKLYGKY